MSGEVDLVAAVFWSLRPLIAAAQFNGIDSAKARFEFHARHFHLVMGPAGPNTPIAFGCQSMEGLERSRR